MSDSHDPAFPAGFFGPSPCESWLSRQGPYVLLLGYLYYCTQIALALFDERWDFHEALLLVPNALVALLAAVGVVLVVRIAAHLIRGDDRIRILRLVLGEPTWWRTWYPPALRRPASVWGRLPGSLKVLRTLIWLELLVLPAGFLLVVFVTPTFRTVYASIGVPVPWLMRTAGHAVTIGGYLLPLVVVAAVVQGRRWQAGLGVPITVALWAFLSTDPGFWRRPDARRLLGE